MNNEYQKFGKKVHQVSGSNDLVVWNRSHETRVKVE